MINDIKRYRERLTFLRNRPILTNPITIYQNKELAFDGLLERLKYSGKTLIAVKEKELLSVKNSYALKSPFQILDKKANKYLQLVSKLETLSPLLTIKRGYSVTRCGDKVVKSVKDVKKDDLLDIELSDGKIKTKVC